MFASPPRYVRGLPQPHRCLVMGVLNVTPDSFSDGGRWVEPDAAIRHGREMLAEGADLLDVGGESTRPGATRPVVAEELDRIMPVITELAAEGAVISVDTMRSEVADAALRAGAVLVNDVSGGLADPEILPAVAAHDGAYAAMHWRAHSETMQQMATYDDVVEDVTRELSDRVQAALDAGIAPDRLAIDPGLGFAKTAEHNWTLLAHLDRLHELGFPLLVGSSRKSFLGLLLADDTGETRPVLEREDATAALSTLTAAAGAWCVRVHRVRGNLDAVQVAQAWAAAERPVGGQRIADPAEGQAGQPAPTHRATTQPSPTQLSPTQPGPSQPGPTHAATEEPQ